jgi:hypothetical protein
LPPERSVAVELVAVPVNKPDDMNLIDDDVAERWQLLRTIGYER